jgi:hypothetical protein
MNLTLQANTRVKQKSILPPEKLAIGLQADGLREAL